MERYSLSLRIQSKCGKMRTRITPNTDTFHAVYWCCKVCTDFEEWRKNIWECMLVVGWVVPAEMWEIFCWRYHASNVPIFKKLLYYSNQSSTSLSMLYESRNDVHLIKGVRNKKRYLHLIDCLPVVRYWHCELFVTECIAIRGQHRGLRSHCRISCKSTQQMSQQLLS